MTTKIQYGIKHMMVLTVMVAVVAAAVSPFVRSWDAKRQVIFTVYLAVVLLVHAGYTYWLCRWRVRAERDAGEVILLTRSADARSTKGIMLGLVAVNVALILTVAILAIHFRIYSGHIVSGLAIFMLALLSVGPAGGNCPIAALLWWGLDWGSIEVCEQGLILGGIRFLSYSKLKHCLWMRYGTGDPTLSTRYRDREMWFRIPAEMREEVGRMLDEKGVPHKEIGILIDRNCS